MIDLNKWKLVQPNGKVSVRDLANFINNISSVAEEQEQRKENEDAD